MAEFYYNNHTSTTTSQTPFYVWYGEHPRFDPNEPKEEQVPAAEDLAKRIYETGQEVKAMIDMLNDATKNKQTRTEQKILFSK